MRRPLLLAALFLVAVAAFRLYAGWADDVPPGSTSTKRLEESGELLITGQVYQKDESSVYLKSVIILESNAFGQSAADSRQEVPCQENIICEIEEAGTVPLGSFVAVRGVFAPYLNATNPGEFDSAVYYRTLEIGGRLRKCELLAVGESNWPVREALYGLKCYFKERLYRIFPEKEAAVMSALLLGDKKDLDSELKDLYKRNGILHILSISSLHITIIGMSVYRLLRRIGLPIPPAAVGGSVLLILYGCMTGFGVSACRAIGMYLIRMLGELTGRTYDMLTALGVMAVVMVAGNPYYLRNSGFLLSFTSVLGIGVVSPALMPKLQRGGQDSGRTAEDLQSMLREKAERIGASLAQSVSASLAITLTTLPIQLWFYYEIPVYSVFLNLFVLPLMKPMMITGLLALLIPGLGLLGWIDTCILKSYEILCSGFDRLPFHTWNPGCPKVWQIGLYYLLLAGAVLLRTHMQDARSREPGIPGVMGTREREQEEKAPWSRFLEGSGANAIWIGGIVAAVLAMALGPPAANSVTFLDVGQGDCILVRTASGESYLFDCGSSSRRNVGKYVLIPYLKYNGIRDIDAIFLSHPDADHVNGAVELLEIGGENNLTVGQLLLPAIREEARQEQLGELASAAAGAGQAHPVPTGYLQAGDAWSCGSASFLCLHPREGLGTEDVNAYSLCFYVTFREEASADTARDSTGGSWTMLLTGDVQNEGEEALQKELAARDIKGITLLKAAHHGSKNSTPEELLERLSPLLTVISSGRNNRYGHPHAELLERLEAAGTVIVETARSGAVTVTVRDGGLRVMPFCEGLN